MHRCPSAGNSMTSVRSGASRISGTAICSIVTRFRDVSRNFAHDGLSNIDRSGCFACFCPCCMGCKLAKNMGESSVIGCFPGSWFYLRTKIRAARRIDVRSKHGLGLLSERFSLGIVLRRLLCDELLCALCGQSNGHRTRISAAVGPSQERKDRSRS